MKGQQVNKYRIIFCDGGPEEKDIEEAGNGGPHLDGESGEAPLPDVVVERRLEVSVNSALDRGTSKVLEAPDAKAWRQEAGTVREGRWGHDAGRGSGGSVPPNLKVWI